MLWRPLAGWADAIYDWARSVGLEDSVTTVDEISAGDEAAGTGDSRHIALCLTGQHQPASVGTDVPILEVMTGINIHVCHQASMHSCNQ